MRRNATYIDHGYYGAGLSIPANQNVKVGNPVSVFCSGSGTCTIQADQFIQVGGGCFEGACGLGQFLIGFYLDGVPDIDAQIVGLAPPYQSNYYQVEATSELQNNVSPGWHTVQIYVSATANGTLVYNYNTNFRVYKP
jgi:hypothetical protein